MGKPYSLDLRSAERENFTWRKYIPARSLSSSSFSFPRSLTGERPGCRNLDFRICLRSVEAMPRAHRLAAGRCSGPACGQLPPGLYSLLDQSIFRQRRHFPFPLRWAVLLLCACEVLYLPFAKRRHRGHTFLKRQLAIQRSYLKVDALPDDLSDRDVPQICPWPATATAAQELTWTKRTRGFEPRGQNKSPRGLSPRAHIIRS
jgi:hypothetical protein